ncbi:MAG: hypothetical protein AAGF79_04850 [Pseudomonadota bacterium]
MLTQPTLGVLKLEYTYEPVLGDVDHPGTFDYPVIYREIPGLTFEMCQSGTLTDEVKAACKAAVEDLDDQGVCGITGSCGFMIRIEPLVTPHTDKPVFLSSLDQLPLILRSLEPDAEVAIFTANGDSLASIEPQLDQLCGVVDHSPRIHIIGCQDVPGFDAVAKAEKVDTAKVVVGLLALARQVLDEYPRINCLLLECTELGCYANALRQMSGLPVYDAITYCNSFMSGFTFDTKFGVQP